jgi:exoribonuclease-2
MSAAGTEVAWWDRDDRLSFGIVAGEEKGRVRLILVGGKQQRVPPSRIAFTLGQLRPPPGAGHEERRRAARRVEAVSEKVRQQAAGIEVPVLWELALESDDPPDLGALAELALGRDDGPSRAVVTVALADDATLFVRRGARWEPRSWEIVDGIRRQRRRAAARASEREKALGELAAAVRGETFVLSGSREERRYLRALEEVAIMGAEATRKARVATLEVLETGERNWDRPEDGAFRLLRRVGRFASDDQNLQIVRYGLRTSFPDEVEREARQAAERGFVETGRSDLTGLDIITIDSLHTREIDDGLSVETLGEGRRRMGIHIADPAAFVEPGGAVDSEALARTTSHYFPDCRLPMLPEAISHHAASLSPGETRPALSFLVEVDDAGEVVGYEIVRSVVRSRARLDYDRADEILRESSGAWHGPLADLAVGASALERAREARGAVRILSPEIDVRVIDGEIVLERIDPGATSRRIVSEAMVLAGAVAAKFCVERDLPALFRRQPAPAESPETVPLDPRDPVAVRALRRGLRRGEVGIEPGSHFALGLPAYVQVTSPLRRYQDLAMHRQIIAAVEGRERHLDREALQRIAASTERADHDGRRAEAAADRYWLLRALEPRAGESVEGIVVEVEPRPVVLLLETLLEVPMPGLAGATSGERLRLRVERVNPRADLLELGRPERGEVS